MEQELSLESLRRLDGYHRTRQSWRGAQRRCRCETNPQWKRYGGRGIKFDPIWNDFWQFVVDMGLRPYGMVLDRIDNDGDYTPGNCRWTTYKVSGNNKSQPYHKPKTLPGNRLTRHFEYRRNLKSPKPKEPWASL